MRLCKDGRLVRLLERELTGFAKATVILVPLLLLAIGLCTFTGSLEAHRGWSYLGGRGFPKTALADALIALDWIGAAMVVISVAGLAFVIIGWPLSIVYRRVAGTDCDLNETRLNLNGKDDDQGTER